MDTDTSPGKPVGGDLNLSGAVDLDTPFARLVRKFMADFTVRQGQSLIMVGQVHSGTSGTTLMVAGEAPGGPEQLLSILAMAQHFLAGSLLEGPRPTPLATPIRPV